MPDPKLTERQWELLDTVYKHGEQWVMNPETIADAIDLVGDGLLTIVPAKIAHTPAGRALAERRKDGEV